MFLEKLVRIIVIGVIIFLWNKFPLKIFMTSVNDLSNRSKLKKQSNKYPPVNMDQAHKLVSVIFWLGYIIIAHGILIGDIP